MMFHRNFFTQNCWEFAFFSPWNIFLTLIFIAIIVIGAVILIKRSKVKTADSALDELKQRYVKGEISQEEYIKSKIVLSDK